MGIFGYSRGVFGKDTRLKTPTKEQEENPALQSNDGVLSVQADNWFNKLLDKLDEIFTRFTSS